MFTRVNIVENDGEGGTRVASDTQRNVSRRYDCTDINHCKFIPCNNARLAHFKKQFFMHESSVFWWKFSIALCLSYIHKFLSIISALCWNIFAFFCIKYLYLQERKEAKHFSSDTLLAAESYCALLHSTPPHQAESFNSRRAFFSFILSIYIWLSGLGGSVSKERILTECDVF